MKTNFVAPRDPISEYLNQVSSGLTGISELQRQEIVAEIRSHLAERVQQFAAQGFLQPAEAAVAAMGDADDLAHQFAHTVHQQKASRSFVPWVLLRAAAQIALTGINGVAVFLLGVFGYATALGFTVAAILKPIMPTRVGFWVGPHLFVWGMPDLPMDAHELAGQYFVPVSLVLAFLFASGTTLALQWLMRRSLSMGSLVKKSK